MPCKWCLQCYITDHFLLFHLPDLLTSLRNEHEKAINVLLLPKPKETFVGLACCSYFVVLIVHAFSTQYDTLLYVFSTQCLKSATSQITYTELQYNACRPNTSIYIVPITAFGIHCFCFLKYLYIHIEFKLLMLLYQGFAIKVLSI